MKHSLLLFVSIGLFFGFCTRKEANPLLMEFNTPFSVPPFEEIKAVHYSPALRKGMEQQKVEIEAIIQSQDAPTFENTVETLEKSGVLLARVKDVFDNLTSANTNEQLQAIAKEVAPILSKHEDDIFMNDRLFRRIEMVYKQKEQLEADVEKEALLEKWYRRFLRGGAQLNAADRSRLREINEELSLLAVRFGENLLEENNTFELLIKSKKDLEGLPEAAVTAAAETARERGHENRWVFTLQKPSMIPFLQYSKRRDLREQIFKAYTRRGNNGNDLDNNEIVSRMVTLRTAKAGLLGYSTYAHYVLEERMANDSEKVYELLEQLWTPALAAAREEARRLQEMINAEGGDFALEPWDWWFYTEKLRKERFDLDEEVLKPYFQLENVRDGAFAVANRLYGIVFLERPGLPKYHKDVQSFEVRDRDGSHLGVLFLDYFPRASKEGGAWMSSYRKQNEGVRPVVSNVCNFSRPTAGRPALLSCEEVSTLFHEFGHALHGLLSDCRYRSLSGTDVAWDFVELPSQIMENWAFEPSVLRMYARHFETGQPIPEELAAKIREGSKFNRGFEAVEYLAASFLDMDWHCLRDTQKIHGRPGVDNFEAQVMDRIRLIPQIVPRYKSTYFSHIFDGSYPAGYYSYYWAEVLDADAFQAFKETGIFDQKTAQLFRENILAKGATEDPMTLYLRFRGAEPRIEAMLERKGLN